MGTAAGGHRSAAGDTAGWGAYRARQIRTRFAIQPIDKDDAIALASQILLMYKPFTPPAKPAWVTHTRRTAAMSHFKSGSVQLKAHIVIVCP